MLKMYSLLLIPLCFAMEKESEYQKKLQEAFNLRAQRMTTNDSTLSKNIFGSDDQKFASAIEEQAKNLEYLMTSEYKNISQKFLDKVNNKSEMNRKSINDPFQMIQTQSRMDEYKRYDWLSTDENGNQSMDARKVVACGDAEENKDVIFRYSKTDKLFVLHEACKLKNHKMVGYILDLVEMKNLDQTEHTALLQNAIDTNNDILVRILLNHGANMNNVLTPQKTTTKIRKLLSKHKEKTNAEEARKKLYDSTKTIDFDFTKDFLVSSSPQVSKKHSGKKKKNKEKSKNIDQLSEAGSDDTTITCSTVATSYDVTRLIPKKNTNSFGLSEANKENHELGYGDSQSDMAILKMQKLFESQGEKNYFTKADTKVTNAPSTIINLRKDIFVKQEVLKCKVTDHAKEYMLKNHPRNMNVLLTKEKINESHNIVSREEKRIKNLKNIRLSKSEVENYLGQWWTKYDKNGQEYSFNTVIECFRTIEGTVNLEPEYFELCFSLDKKKLVTYWLSTGKLN